MAKRKINNPIWEPGVTRDFDSPHYFCGIPSINSRRPSLVSASNRLWVAVLLSGIVDAHRLRAGLLGREEGREIERDLSRWFSKGSNEVGSFAWICEELELDDSYLREKSNWGAIVQRFERKGERASWSA